MSLQTRLHICFSTCKAVPTASELNWSASQKSMKHTFKKPAFTSRMKTLWSHLRVELNCNLLVLISSLTYAEEIGTYEEKTQNCYIHKYGYDIADGTVWSNIWTAVEESSTTLSQKDKKVKN